MLQCYVLTCGRSVTTILAPPRRQRPGQGPRLPHPKAGPDYGICQIFVHLLQVSLLRLIFLHYFCAFFTWVALGYVGLCFSLIFLTTSQC
jgi:hypothetical protein